MSPAALVIQRVAVVVRSEVVLTHEELAEDVQRSVYIHVETEQPLPQFLRVAQWKPVEDYARSFNAETGVDAALDNHFLNIYNSAHYEFSVV